MQQGQFGRRGAILNGTPMGETNPPRSAARPAPERPAHINANGTFNGWRWIVMTATGGLLLLVWIDALFSGTSLITPMDENLLWTMRGIGAVLGLVVGLLMFKQIAEQNSTSKAVLTVLFLPLMFAVLFNVILWRAADWATFGFSSQPYEEARYAIESISPGRKGRRDTISIDPFNTGEDTDIPVSDAQYRELLETPASYCVTVMQRRAPSGAVEILNDGQYTLHEPAPVEVGPCDGSSPSGEAATGSNPWSKE